MMFYALAGAMAGTPAVGWTTPAGLTAPTADPRGPWGAGLGDDVRAAAIGLDSRHRVVLATAHCAEKTSGEAPGGPCAGSIRARRWNGAAWEVLEDLARTVSWPVDLEIATDEEDLPVIAIAEGRDIHVRRTADGAWFRVTVPGDRAFWLVAATGLNGGGALWASHDGTWTADAASDWIQRELALPTADRRWASAAAGGVVAVTAARRDPDRGWGWGFQPSATWPGRANLPDGHAVLLPAEGGARWSTLDGPTRRTAPVPVEGRAGARARATPVLTGVHEGDEIGTLRVHPARGPEPPPLPVAARLRAVHVLDADIGLVVFVERGGASTLVRFDGARWTGFGVAPAPPRGLGTGHHATRPAWVDDDPLELRWIAHDPDAWIRVQAATANGATWTVRDLPLPAPRGDCLAGAATHWFTFSRPDAPIELMPLCDAALSWLGDGPRAPGRWDLDTAGWTLLPVPAAPPAPALPAEAPPGASVDGQGPRTAVAWHDAAGVRVRVRSGSGWAPLGGPDPVVAGIDPNVIVLTDRVCVAFAAPDFDAYRIGVLCHPWPP